MIKSLSENMIMLKLNHLKWYLVQNYFYAKNTRKHIFSIHSMQSRDNDRKEKSKWKETYNSLWNSFPTRISDML